MWDYIETWGMNYKRTGIYQYWILTKILYDEYIMKYISNYLLGYSYYKLKCKGVSCNGYAIFGFYNHKIFFEDYEEYLNKLNNVYKNLLFNYLYNEKYRFYPSKYKKSTISTNKDFLNISTSNGENFGPITKRQYYVKLVNTILSKDKLDNILVCSADEDINVIKNYKDVKKDYFLTDNTYEYIYYPTILCKPYLEARFFKLENDEKNYGVVFDTGLKIIKIRVDREDTISYLDKYKYSN